MRLALNDDYVVRKIAGSQVGLILRTRIIKGVKSMKSALIDSYVDPTDKNYQSDRKSENIFLLLPAYEHTRAHLTCLSVCADAHRGEKSQNWLKRPNRQCLAALKNWNLFQTFLFLREVTFDIHVAIRAYAAYA